MRPCRDHSQPGVSLRLPLAIIISQPIVSQPCLSPYIKLAIISSKNHECFTQKDGKERQKMQKNRAKKGRLSEKRLNLPCHNHRARQTLHGLTEEMPMPSVRADRATTSVNHNKKLFQVAPLFLLSSRIKTTTMTIKTTK